MSEDRMSAVMARRRWHAVGDKSLGVMAVLARELVRAGAVDAPSPAARVGRVLRQRAWRPPTCPRAIGAGSRSDSRRCVTAALAPEQAANGQGD
jgi:hypothetical protein